LKDWQQGSHTAHQYVCCDLFASAQGLSAAKQHCCAPEPRQLRGHWISCSELPGQEIRAGGGRCVLLHCQSRHIRSSCCKPFGRHTSFVLYVAVAQVCVPQQHAHSRGNR
jgi:hypothetical protein